jgi:hypothetical protein
VIPTRLAGRARAVPLSEGYRITCAHSSQKQRLDEAARSERIQRARHALKDLDERLAGQRARISSRVAAEEAAAATLTAPGANREGDSEDDHDQPAGKVRVALTHCGSLLS